MTNHAGFECPISVDGVDYHCVKWGGTATAAEIDVTTTAGYDATDQACYTDFIPGPRSFEGSFLLVYDSDLSPIPALREGGFITLLKLNCTLTNKYIQMKAFIRTLRIEPTDIAGRVEVEVTFRNKGRYQYTNV